ncbi:hypothetical protein AMTR_s00119p00133390 [Amborella trichopoda]|uniref:Uncharacterized protein n=1 Tax=Amborella trichopoda TaxID=13333 RepID=W1NNI0_AMBTC|nr:hypothetical protein AMTR_s00119p00133390 [Amborella trichopoda]
MKARPATSRLQAPRSYGPLSNWLRAPPKSSAMKARPATSRPQALAPVAPSRTGLKSTTYTPKPTSKRIFPPIPHPFFLRRLLGPLASSLPSLISLLHPFQPR